VLANQSRVKIKNILLIIHSDYFAILTTFWDSSPLKTNNLILWLSILDNFYEFCTCTMAPLVVKL